MNEKTKNQIERIYNNTNQIFFIYNLLKSLELLNKKETEVYKAGLEALQLAISEEESLYYYFIKNPSEIIYLARLIVEETFHLFDLNDFDIITSQTVEDLINSRIKNQVNKRIVKVIYDSYFNEFIKNSEELEDFIAVLNNSSAIRMTSFLENSIRNEQNKNIKDYLLSVKLSLSFLNEKVEQMNLANGFKQVPNMFDQELIFNTQDLEKLNEMKNLHGERLLLQAFDELCVFADKDLMSPLAHAQSIFFNGLLRTSLLYFSEDYLAITKLDLQDDIEEYRYLLEYSYEDISLVEDLVADAFDSINDIKRIANSDLPKEKSL